MKQLHHFTKTLLDRFFDCQQLLHNLVGWQVVHYFMRDLFVPIETEIISVRLNVHLRHTKALCRPDSLTLIGSSELRASRL